MLSSQATVSCAQFALWTTFRNNPEDCSYNLPVAFYLNERLDIKCLEEALNIVLNTHPILLVNFRENSGQLTQQVQQNKKLIVHTFASDLSCQELLTQVKIQAYQKFDLVNELLFRVCIFLNKKDKDVILFTCHHIISDGIYPWFIKEVIETYQLLANKQIHEYPLPINKSYFEFVQWEQSYLASNQATQDRVFWHTYLMDNDYRPLFLMKSENSERKIKVKSFDIKHDLYLKLQNFARSQRVSLFNLFLTAFNIVAYKYTGSTNINIATALRARQTSGLLNSHGYYSNLAIIRSKTNSQQSLLQIIKENQNNVFKILQHGNYPFYYLANELQFDIETNPPFSASIVFHDKQLSFLANCHPLLDPIIEICQLSNFDFILEIIEGNNDATILLKYNSNKIEEWQVAQFITHYLNVLNYFLPEYQNICLANINVLTENENELIHSSNQTDVQYPLTERLDHLFKKACQTYFSNYAIETESEKYTYAQLDYWSGVVADKLQQLNDGKILAICIDKSKELIIAILAAVKANLTYLPIDPTYPQHRIDFMLADSYSHAILTSDSLVAIFKDQKNILSINQILEAHPRRSNPSLLLSHCSLVYVIYTSGSTGFPKPVAISHSSLINLAYSQIKEFQINSSSKILQFASISFDAAMSEIWTALLSGATLVIPSTKYLGGQMLADIINHHRVSVVTLPPSVLHTLPEKPMPSLQTLIVAGESIHSHLLMKWRDKVKRFINAYGPTEGTVCATLFHYENTYLPNIIGKPIDNVKAYILDTDLNFVPLGVPGELYLAGVGLADGYLHHHELEVEKFISHSHVANRLYKTGDRVRYLADGKIQYLGRYDNQIKINGVRIELEEIEKFLYGHPHVNRCVLIANQTDNIYLSAYIELNGQPDPHLEDLLRSYLLKYLPSSMVPSQFVFLNALPLLTNGKVDRQALKNMQLDEVKETHQVFSVAEQNLINIYAAVLKLNQSQIKIDVNFFNMGGTSLTAIQVIAHIKKELAFSISIQEFFNTSSIQQLAKMIELQRASLILKKTFFNIEDDLNLTIPNLYSPIPIRTCSAEIKHILLTGVTGFLGVHLLFYLLKHTDAEVHCLVKENATNITRKLEKQLLYFNFNQLDRTRVKLYSADLSKKQCGLSTAHWEELTSKIDSIYHCAAQVNHIYSYDLLRPTNVLGMHELIQFSLTKKNKLFYYISSIDVALFDKNIADEIPYIQTKWVGEELLKKASQTHYLPIKIFRPGNIMGQSTSGYINPDHNHFLRLTKGCIQLQQAPKWDWLIEMTPVDIIAESIIKLSLLPNENGISEYNLHNPYHITWDSYLDLFRSFGITMNYLEAEIWKREYLQFIDETNALFPFKELYLDQKINSNQSIKNLDSDIIQKKLKDLGVHYPSCYRVLISTYYSYLKNIGFL